MDRRRFLRLGAGAAAVRTLQAYAAPIGFSANAKSKPKDMTAAEFHEARRFVRTKQGRIAYFELGTGPVAVFLHGFPLNSFQWRGVIPRLAEYRQMHRARLLGARLHRGSQGAKRETHGTGRYARSVSPRTLYRRGRPDRER